MFSITCCLSFPPTVELLANPSCYVMAIKLFLTLLCPTLPNISFYLSLYMSSHLPFIPSTVVLFLFIQFGHLCITVKVMALIESYIFIKSLIKFNFLLISTNYYRIFFSLSLSLSLLLFLFLCTSHCHFKRYKFCFVISFWCFRTREADHTLDTAPQQLKIIGAVF